MILKFTIPFTCIRVFIYGTSPKIGRTRLWLWNREESVPGRIYVRGSLTIEFEHGPMQATKAQIYSAGKGHVVECMPFHYRESWTLFSFGTRPLTKYKPWIVLFNHQFN